MTVKVHYNHAPLLRFASDSFATLALCKFIYLLIYLLTK